MELLREKGHPTRKEDKQMKHEGQLREAVEKNGVCDVRRTSRCFSPDEMCGASSGYRQSALGCGQADRG